MDTTSGVAVSSTIQPSGNNEIRRNKETRTYAELHLAGDTALQNGDLDAAEGHFASAMKEIHDQQSPRLREEEECLRKLGTVYARRGVQTKDGQDFAKATALYNAALARNGDKHLLIDSIKEAEQLFLYHTVGVDCKPPLYETDIEHKNLLEEYRNEVKARLETIHNDHNPYQYHEDDPLVKEVEMKRAGSIKDLFKDISKQRKKFIKNLVEECIKTIGPTPCKYAMIGLGSQATELVTPYSDLEFAILIEENKDTPENKEYFFNLTCYLYLKIINLGETILPAVGIKSLNNFYSEDPEDKWFYDSVTPRGFAFDGAMPWASKTPFGRESTKTKPAVSLIQTPAGMAEFQRQDVALAHGYHLSSILRHVSFLAGDQALVDDYMTRVKRLYQASWAGVIQVLGTLASTKHCGATNPVFTSFHESFRTLWSDTYWLPTGNLLNVKKDIYRFPTVAVVTLGLLGGVYATSIWDAIQEMEETGVVTKENAHHLQVLVSISGELRLRTYLELRGQKENLSGLVAMRTPLDGGSETLINSVFHVPDQKMMFRYYYTAHPLKTNIIGLTHIPIDDLSTTHLGLRVTLYDASPSVKAGICQGLLHFKAAIVHTENALRKLDVDKAATTCLPGQSQEVTLYSRISLLGQKAASYSSLGDHRKAICCWEEQLKEQQQLCQYDLKVVVLYFIIAMAWNRLRDTENVIANLQQGWALMPDKDAVFMDPEITALVDDLIANAVMAERGEIHNLDKAYGGKQMISYLEKLTNMLKELYGDLLPVRGVMAAHLRNFGELFNLMGDYTKAITFTEESLEVMRTIYGQDSAHPDIAALLTNLGISSCRGLHDHAKAIRYHEEALIMYKVVYKSGTPHPATPDILHKLGIEWLHLGEYKKARGYFEQASQMLIHGRDEACHPDMLHVAQNLRLLFDDSGQLARDYNNDVGDNADARACIDQILKMFEGLYGSVSHSRDNAMLHVALGELAEKIGDNLKAIGFYEKALKMTKELLGNSMGHSEYSWVLFILGSVCRKEGEYRKALQYYKNALEIFKDIHGQETAHPTIVESLGNLAVVYKELGDHKKALSFYEQALEMNKEIHGPTTPHLDTAVSLHDMGEVCEESGDNLKAISCFEEALKMMEEIFDKSNEHLAIAMLLGKLGSACRNAAEYQKALQYYERTLETYKRIHDQDASHPDIADSLNNLAAVYEDLGNHLKAIQLHEEALDITKLNHANKTNERGEVCHPNIARLLHKIGHIWNVMGDNDKALSFCEQALKMNRELYGPTTPHHDTAMVLLFMGIAFEESGDNMKAKSCYEETLKMEGIFDKCKKHHLIASLLDSLGSACRKAGEYQKALQYCQRALETKKGIHGPDAVHPDIVRSLRNLAIVYKDLGDYIKAIQLYEDMLDMTKLIHGGNETHERDEVCHPDIARALDNLGSLWHMTGDNKKAIAFYEQAFKMNQELHGPTTPHRDTATLLGQMGVVFVESGDNLKAISCYEEILRMKEIFVESKEHHVIASLLVGLGSACRNAGEYQKALRYYHQALETNKGIHGPDAVHPDIVHSLRKLAEVYKDLGDYIKAIQLCEDALKITKLIHGGNETHEKEDVRHPDIACILEELGSLWHIAGENKKAIAFFEQALKMNQELYCPTTPHRDTATLLVQMGVVFEETGDNLKAISCYEEALNMLEEIFVKSKDHHVIALLLGVLGSACRKTAEYEKALQYYQRALETNKDIHGQDTTHPAIADSLRNIAAVYEDLGSACRKAREYQKALTYYKRGLETNKGIHGQDTTHPAIADSLRNIAAVYEDLGSACRKAGEYQKGLQYYKQALETNKDIHGQDVVHPAIAYSLRNLAAAHKDLRNYTIAIQLYEDALKMTKTIHGVNATQEEDEVRHLDVVVILNELGCLWGDVGNYERADAFLKQALKMCQDMWPGHPTP